MDFLENLDGYIPGIIILNTFPIDSYCPVNYLNSFFRVKLFSLQTWHTTTEGSRRYIERVFGEFVGKRKNDPLDLIKTDKLIFCVRHILFSIIFITSVGNLEIFSKTYCYSMTVCFASILSFCRTFSNLLFSLYFTSLWCLPT